MELVSLSESITDRIDAITRIPEAYRKSVLPAPKSVKIEVSPRCNYLCGFCALRTRENPPKEDMEFDLFRRITSEMKDSGVQEIGLFYLGESFMDANLLISCITHCTQIGIPYIFLTTNGSLANHIEVERCMKAGLHSLKWSVNAATPEQFSKIMGVSKKLFWQALSNIKSAWAVRQARHYETRLYASSIAYDGQQMQEMQNLLEQHVKPYVDEHYWLPLYSMGAFATEREQELGYRPIAGNQGRLGALRNPLPCWSCFTEGHVTARGELSACCFDANSKWIMGDLTKQSFMDAWNSKAFQDLRTAHLARNVKGTMCEHCVAYQ